MPRFNIPEKKDFLCVGVITQAHSLRGEVLVKSFLNDDSLFDKEIKLYSIDDVEYKVETIRSSNKGLLIKFKNIGNRNQAEKSRKTYLYIAKSALPEIEDDEIYYYELKNYIIIDELNNKLGSVKNAFDTGANTILDIKLLAPVEKDGKVINNVLIPFTPDMVLKINKQDSKLTVDKELFGIYINL